MYKIGIFIVSLLFASPLLAQKQDTLLVEQGADGWEINHLVKNKETVFSIARKYHVPPVLLAAYNEINIRQALKPGNYLYIPLGAYNLEINNMHTSEMRPIYHRLRIGESLRRIAKNSGVNQTRLLDWNDMTADDIVEGQLLLVGWVLYDATTIQNIETEKLVNKTPASPTTLPSKTEKNTSPIIAKSPFIVNTNKSKDSSYTIVIPPKKTDTTAVEKSAVELLYDSQTENGLNATTEKGPASFFNANNANPSYYYAFHNTAKRGSIIKIKNINNGKTVFVKVVGAIPGNGMYHNSIIVISSKTRHLLGATGEKMWCELSYAR